MSTYMYRKLPKIRPPFLHTTFRQKWGGGVCSNIQFVSCIRPLCAYAFTNLIDDDLNQKLTKHSQKTLDTGRLHGGKIPM